MRGRGSLWRKAKQIFTVCLGLCLLFGTLQTQAYIDMGMRVGSRQARISTPSDADEMPEKATDSNAKPSRKEEAPLALGRILVEETFDNGENWDINNLNAITVRDGKAHIKGSGPNNRMGYKIGKISADDFLIELEMTVNQGNKNSNAKIAFKASEYEGERLQLRFDFPGKKIYLEKTKNNGSGTYTKIWSEGTSFHESADTTYQVSILTEENTITVYIDGQAVLSVTKSDVSGMKQGYFVIAGQYPAQDFSIGNLVISTDEEPKGDEYMVTLKTAVDGIVDEDGQVSVGGILRADRVTGYAGDTITLQPIAKYGYVFDRFESFKQDGTSTDGLMPIMNNKFQLNEKFGDVTVVAHFKKREAGKFELFYDGFGADALNAANQYKSIRNEDYAVLKDGELVLDTENGSNWVLVDQTVYDSLTGEEGYRISLDVRKENTNNGTVQVMFKGHDDGIEDRYALVINSQGSAMFRRFRSDNSNTELKRCSFLLTTAMFHAQLEIIGDTVTFYADGKEMMSYTDGDDWMGLPDAAGIINMTSGAPVVFDEFLIERIPKTAMIEVAVKYEDNGVQIEDSEFKSGTARSNVKRVVEGDEVKLQSVAKAGWRFKEYGVDGDVNLEIREGRFTVPAGAPGIIRVVAVFEPETLREAKTFYIDSRGGLDSNPGDSETEPWQTLSRLKLMERLVPGDRICLKRGSKFNGEALSFRGMGTEGNPIVIDAYGEGDALPCINGDGQVVNVVSLYNQEYIEIRNLEITNTDSKYNDSFELNASNNTSQALRAINVSIKDFGTASGIVIEDCYIHDINGNINLKWNGGIFFDVKADIEGGELIGIPSRYDDVLIAGCTFQRVDRSGIKLVSSGWCNQWEANSPGIPVNWYPSTNVVVRDNYMEKIGGDGITVRDTDGALVEYNLVRDCRYQKTGYNVGIWPFEAANTVIQYNEAYDTHGTQDGQGLDCDHASSYSVAQYNYSHNNEGGFMLIMGGYPHTAPTVRYNVSQNDRDKTFEFAQGIPNGTMIYNNTIYSDRAINRGVMFLSNTGAGLGVNDLYLFNNLFWYPEGQVLYGASGDTAKLKRAARFWHNAYAGGMAAADADEGAIAVWDAGLAGVGTAPAVNNTGRPRTGKSGALDGYKLLEGSPMIDAGVSMEEAVAYFGGDDTVDGRAYSPRELYEEAKAGNKGSIAYAMGRNFPEVHGVNYHTDFFGNENLAGGRPDIGAAEYSK